jgi:hypothetical protein
MASAGEQLHQGLRAELLRTTMRPADAGMLALQ